MVSVRGAQVDALRFVPQVALRFKMTRFKLALPLSLALAVAAPTIAAAQQAAAPAAAADVAQFAGKPLYGPKGERIGAVYKVTAGGVPQLILNGKLVNVPASSLSVAEGKLSTSLDKKQLAKAAR